MHRSSSWADGSGRQGVFSHVLPAREAQGQRERADGQAAVAQLEAGLDDGADSLV
ncbi:MULTISPECIES: hypothetical protein [Streptomyces]|uniref:Uncharacterized protein n=1 Tax=Streptomyces flaveolus TaxID=67297 RepID=A0ABV3ADG4_9ACTN|nr:MULTISPECIES: hypothetical protein [Streptomyces]